MFATVVETIVNNEYTGSHVGFTGDVDQRETHVRAIENLGYTKYCDGDGFEMLSYSYYNRGSLITSIVIVCDLNNLNGKHVFDRNLNAEWLRK